MAFLGLKVPHEAARLLSEAEASIHEGTSEPLDQYHVTMVYLGKGVSIEELARAIAPIFDVTSETRPFTISTSHIGTFNYNGETVPIVALIDSPELHLLHERITESLDLEGVEFSKKWKDYRPHVTLGYSKDADLAGSIDVHLPVPLTWGAHELVLWGGDAGDEKLSIAFPFTLGLPKKEDEPEPEKAKKAATMRGAVKLAMAARSLSKPLETRATTADRILHRFLMDKRN